MLTAQRLARWRVPLGWLAAIVVLVLADPTGIKLAPAVVEVSGDEIPFEEVVAAVVQRVETHG